MGDKGLQAQPILATGNQHVSSEPTCEHATTIDDLMEDNTTATYLLDAQPSRTTNKNAKQKKTKHRTQQHETHKSKTNTNQKKHLSFRQT